MTSVNTQDDKLNSFYSRVHPGYNELINHWRFCKACYVGGRSWFDENLFSYAKEGEKKFEERKKRAYRFNHTREAVDLLKKYLFKAQAKRDEDGAPDQIKRFWKRASKSGQGVDHLMQLISTMDSTNGFTAVVVDRPRAPEAAVSSGALSISVKEAEEMRRDCYAYPVSAVDILDFAFDDDDGELLWIKLREFVRDDKDPINSSGEMEERVRLWTRSDWTVFSLDITKDALGNKISEKVNIKDSGVHGLGFVPVFLSYHATPTDPYRPSSLIDDIAYLDRSVANYASNLDAIIQDQTFSQLAIPASALPGDRSSAQKVMVEMGTRSIFTYDAGAGSTAKPEFIAPDPKQAGVILDVINKLISEIYHTIGLAGERTKQDNAVGIDNSSGVAKAYDFERVNSLLVTKARAHERLENWLVKTVLAWDGESEPDEALVTYPESFDIASLGDEIATAEALMKVNAPIELRREHMKAVLAKLLPQIPSEKYDDLLDAIDAWEATAPGFEKTLEAKANVGAVQTGKEPTGLGSLKNRQGAVTAKTKTTPKNQPK